MTNQNDIQPSSAGRRSRLEIRTILLIVAALLVIGALYTAFFGSPTRNRAGIDSQNNPYPLSNQAERGQR